VIDFFGASLVVSVVVVVVVLLGAIGVAGVVVVLDVVVELDVLASGAFASVAGAGAGAGAGVGATTTAGGAGGGVTVFSWQAASAMTADAMTRSGLFMFDSFFRRVRSGWERSASGQL